MNNYDPNEVLELTDDQVCEQLEMSTIIKITNLAYHKNSYQDESNLFVVFGDAKALDCFFYDYEISLYMLLYEKQAKDFVEKHPPGKIVFVRGIYGVTNHSKRILTIYDPQTFNISKKFAESLEERFNPSNLEFTTVTDEQ